MDATGQQPTTTGPSATTPYFANLPADELIAEVDTRETAWWNMVNNRGLPNLWRLCYAQAFGMDPSGARNATQKLEFCGPQQNYVRFRVNLTRSLIKQRNVLAQGQRIAVQCLAMNDDASSIAQVPIASKVMEYIFRSAEGERVCWEALESDGYFGEGWIWARWNIDGGDMVPVTKQVPVIDQFTGQPLTDPTGQVVMQPQQSREKSGAPILQSAYPWQVFGEPFARKSMWQCIKEPASKFELMALYPELAERLEGMSLSFGSGNSPHMNIAMFMWDSGSVTNDMVLVKHWYHAPCKAVPNGRYVSYCGDVVLSDGPCPIADGVPLVSVCSGRYFGTSLGYPESADLFSMQEMIDELLSQSATNILKFGNQNLWGVDGLEFDMDSFMKGGAFFTMKDGQEPPKVIEYAELPEAVKYLLEYLPERMNEVIGSNSVMRGEPSANISSGAFAALLQNVAEKYATSTQMTYDFAVNTMLNVMLDLVRTNVDTSFVAEVAGANNAPYMKYFTSQDLQGIRRVLVQRQTPLMNSIPGRFDVFMATKDLPPDLKYAAVHMLNTGDPSAWTDNDFSELVLVQWEDEQMLAGNDVEPSKIDDIYIHQSRHKATLNKLRACTPPQDPQANQLWQAAQAALVKHIGMHPVVWVQTDPAFAQSLRLPAPPTFDPMTGQFGNGGPPTTNMQGAPPGKPAPKQLPGGGPNGPDGGLPKPAEPAAPPAAANGAPPPNG